MYIGNGLYVDAVFENIEITYAKENHEPILSVKEEWKKAKANYDLNIALLGFNSEENVR
jgi:hypothetical protein